MNMYSLHEFWALASYLKSLFPFILVLLYASGLVLLGPVCYKGLAWTGLPKNLIPCLFHMVLILNGITNTGSTKNTSLGVLMEVWGKGEQIVPSPSLVTSQCLSPTTSNVACKPATTNNNQEPADPPTSTAFSLLQSPYPP